MTSYVDAHADFYDLLYQDKPYAQEAAFVASELQAAGVGQGARVLELACGTARHALELERLGYDVVAVDSSPSMLAGAAARRAGAGSSVGLVQQDMRELDVPGRPFDGVVSFFDSIGYVATNEALQLVLRGVYAHLRPGGTFVFEFWHAAAMLRSYEPTRVRRIALPQGELMRIAETKLDCARQLASVSYTLLVLDRAGTFTRVDETQVNRYFLCQEMAGWLSASGFEAIRFHAGFDRDRPVDLDTWHIVCAAKRPS